ncbi:MAG: dienelactone hydrolase family protein [Deltaproteobacteria bacterium]|nr:dienelactone hydrolase family protein [Deltaproteobacteria bacterium]
MDIQTSTVQVSGDEGKKMDLFIAAPRGDGKRPALITIMEVFGVNDHMKDVTARFAREGYVGVCPDLYYRLEKRVAPNSDLQGAFAMRATLYETKIVEDLNRAIALIKGRADVNPNKIGIIGYCFGGRVSWLGACQCPGITAASIYYGGGIAGGERGEKSPVEPVAMANKIKVPLQWAWGDQDQSISQEAREKIEAALKANKVNYEWHLYKGAGHAFFCDDRPSYHEASAKDIWPKTLSFFAKHLKS